MNPVLSGILDTKQSLSADGKSTIPVHSMISADEGEMLSRLIADRRPGTSLEVGLAFGVSALFICEALRKASPAARHVVIDPAQHADAYWKGAGLANLKRAGFGDMVEFVEKPSQIALPELVTAGRKIDFAFIDGEHTFDHVLVDFFFVDQLLNVGGVVVLDDAGWPSVRRVARFIATNRAYAVIDHVGSEDRRKPQHLAAETPDTVAADKRLGLEGWCIAFEKKADDARHWEHYVPF